MVVVTTRNEAYQMGVSEDYRKGAEDRQTIVNENTSKESLYNRGYTDGDKKGREDKKKESDLFFAKCYEQGFSDWK